ncbi:hypothetical protein OH77DRAFT_1440547 [Trametes cingulata]|nr:hypothetical protein OH77DRAFT_1440547 [Trametes cingulata]
MPESTPLLSILAVEGAVSGTRAAEGGEGGDLDERKGSEAQGSASVQISSTAEDEDGLHRMCCPGPDPPQEDVGDRKGTHQNSCWTKKKTVPPNSDATKGDETKHQFHHYLSEYEVLTYRRGGGTGPHADQTEAEQLPARPAFGGLETMTRSLNERGKVLLKRRDDEERKEE